MAFIGVSQVSILYKLTSIEIEHKIETQPATDLLTSTYHQSPPNQVSDFRISMLFLTSSPPSHSIPTISILVAVQCSGILFIPASMEQITCRKNKADYLISMGERWPSSIYWSSNCERVVIMVLSHFLIGFGYSMFDCSGMVWDEQLRQPSTVVFESWNCILSSGEGWEVYQIWGMVNYKISSTAGYEVCSWHAVTIWLSTAPNFHSRFFSLDLKVCIQVHAYRGQAWPEDDASTILEANNCEVWLVAEVHCSLYKTDVSQTRKTKQQLSKHNVRTGIILHTSTEATAVRSYSIVCFLFLYCTSYTYTHTRQYIPHPLFSIHA